jgi:integrase
MARMPRDTRTRYQGVFARHQKRCRLDTDPAARCNCKPSYYGVVYDRAAGKTIKTRVQVTADAGRNARVDLAGQIERGEHASSDLRLTDARIRFIAAAREGRALNKWGRRYRAGAIDNLEGTLKTHVEPTLGARKLTSIRRGQIQAIIDDRQTELSGSRIRGIVNAVRALYTWAADRDFAGHDPAQHVRLPAMNATPVERVATPAEFARLLAVLDLGDQVAYAAAGYGFARAEQIRRARWQDIDLDTGAVEWGVDPAARKSDAARRVVPCVPPFLAILKRAYLEQGRPAGDQLICPPHYASPSGFISTGGIFKRAYARFDAAGLERINLKGARHSGATWIDAAGVTPKIGSVLMGHTTPALQAGAAPITLARYTHALPDDIERARDQIATYLAQSIAAREAASS